MYEMNTFLKSIPREKVQGNILNYSSVNLSLLGVHVKICNPFQLDVYVQVR